MNKKQELLQEKTIETIFNSEHLTKIDNNLFEVVSKPLVVRDTKFKDPTAFGIYKGTGGTSLGVVGKDYFPTQPNTLFESIIPVMRANKIDFNTLAFKQFKGGKRISFVAPIGEVSFTDMLGKKDRSIINLNIATGYDGNTRTTMYLTTYRLVCKNGMKAWSTEFSIGFKNTHGNAQKVQILMQAFSKAMEHTTSLKDLLIALNQVQYTRELKQQFLSEVLQFDVTATDLHAQKSGILEMVEASIATEIIRTGETFWGLLNGITRYTSHEASCKDRQDYLFTGGGERINNRAQQVASRMVKELA